MKVAIIDTGYSGVPEHCTSINGIAINEINGCISIGNDYSDTIGHGTAVTNLLLEKVLFDVDLFVIKVFDKDLNTSANKLTAGLEYCCEIDCDIVQVSLGTLYANPSMHKAIKELSQKALIVSAFDNKNGLSYPASYEEVLGIDSSQDILDRDKYYLSNDGIVDVCGKDVYFRVDGLERKKIIVHGNSYLCSYISSLILNAGTSIRIKSEAIRYLTTILNLSNRNAIVNPQHSFIQKIMKIRKAIVFPFNKEIYTIAAYERFSDIDILAYYDIKQNGHIGRRICDVLNYTYNEKVIKNYLEINWEDSFDTVICGHTDKISKITKKDVLREITEKCDKYGKQLASFDSISNYLKEYPKVIGWFPNTGNLYVPNNRYGKLRTPNIPVLGIFGTSSRQGKMSFQIQLRNYLKENDVLIKNIGSEPQSFVFGFEYTYAFGYNSVDPLTPYEMICALNEAVFKLSENDCDMIIVGSQSGTVSHQLRNLNMIPLRQYYFLLGTQPDSIILFVNSCDSAEYIKRTIDFFYSTVQAQVVCLIWSDVNDDRIKQNYMSMGDAQSLFGIPVFNLKSLDMEKIKEIIFEYYER